MSAATARKLDSHRPTPVPNGGARAHRKCQYLVTDCKSCGKNMTVTYPTSVTFWKFACTACETPYAIDIVGNRKCLVYELDGRKTVERIGLTDRPQRFFRATCYACSTPTIVAETEMGQVKSCGKCGLDHTIREDRGVHYYETVTVHRGAPTTYRDRVQDLSAHIIHRKNAFFLDADVLPRSDRELVEELAQMESELTVLRRTRQDGKSAVLRLHAEKEALQEQLKTHNGKSSDLAARLLSVEGRAKVLVDENRSLLNKLQAYESVTLELDQNLRKIKELESQNREMARQTLELERQVKAASQENRKVSERLGSHAAVTRELDRFMARCGELEGQNQSLTLERKRLTLEVEQLHNRLNGHGSLARDLDARNQTVRKLESENRTLGGELQKLAARNSALESRLAGYNDLVRDFDRQREMSVIQESKNQDLTLANKRLTLENRRLANRLSGQGEIVQDLDQQAELASRLEVENFDLTQKVRRLEAENKRISSRISAFDETVRNLERQREKAAWAEMSNSELVKRTDQLTRENGQLKSSLDEAKSLVERLGRRIKSGAGAAGKGESQLLERRIQALEKEKSLLEKRLSDESFLQESFRELGRGGAPDKDAVGKAEWYCEEGQEGGISLDVKGGRERRILGLKGEPTPQRIKSALRMRIKKYHPDMIASMGRDLRELAHQKTLEINQAYTTLMAMYG